MTRSNNKMGLGSIMTPFPYSLNSIHRHFNGDRDSDMLPLTGCSTVEHRPSPTFSGLALNLSTILVNLSLFQVQDLCPFLCVQFLKRRLDLKVCCLLL